MMLHQSLVDRGVRDATTIKVMTPMAVPIPISPEASAGIIGALAERGIEFCPETVVTNLDPATHQATLRDGGSVDYDLFLGVPVHRAPAVVEESGIASRRLDPRRPHHLRRRASPTCTRSATSRARPCRASA